MEAMTDKQEPCGECGMLCGANEYHPFAACLMFKGCQNGETVRANLEGVRLRSPAYLDQVLAPLKSKMFRKQEPITGQWKDGYYVTDIVATLLPYFPLTAGAKVESVPLDGFLAKCAQQVIEELNRAPTLHFPYQNRKGARGECNRSAES